MFKVNNKDTRTTPVARFGVFIINFEHISHLVSLSSVSIHPSQLTGSFDFFFLLVFTFLFLVWNLLHKKLLRYLIIDRSPVINSAIPG